MSSNVLHWYTVNCWILSNQIKWNRIFGRNFRIGCNRIKRLQLQIGSFAHPRYGRILIFQSATRGRYEKRIWGITSWDSCSPHLMPLTAFFPFKYDQVYIQIPNST